MFLLYNTWESTDKFFWIIYHSINDICFVKQVKSVLDRKMLIDIRDVKSLAVFNSYLEVPLELRSSKLWRWTFIIIIVFSRVRFLCPFWQSSSKNRIKYKNNKNFLQLYFWCISLCEEVKRNWINLVEFNLFLILFC